MQRIDAKQVTVKIPEELLRAVDEIADEQRVNRSRAIRILLSQAVLSTWRSKGFYFDVEDEDINALVRKMQGEE